MTSSLTITEVINGSSSIETVKELFLEYAHSLGFSLCFQNFQLELAEFPGPYSPPRGALFLALLNGESAGCVALKPLENTICEMKRLYVRPQFRGQGIGKALTTCLINQARALAYQKMRLDTVPTMQEAIVLYRSLGFYDIPPYYSNPIEGTYYMELNLGPHAASSTM